MSKQLFNETKLESWKEIDEDQWQTIALDVAQIFLQTAPQQFEMFTEFWSHKNYSDLKSSAHSLKSSCENVGAEKAAEMFEQIEHDIEAGSFNKIELLIEDLNKIWNESLIRLHQFILKLGCRYVGANFNPR